ncbi:PDZ domain-containing protein [Microcoleus sp.]|uniref:nSTAND1 domain-containing NTPase n=1 Tax=Microcoleus sp. TaxID=44472 RepID=UPI00352635F0
MEKLVTLNISGEFDKGFVVQAEVREDGGTTKNQVNLAIAGASGKLPAHTELLEQYRHWQSLYKNLEEFFPSRLNKTGGWTNASDKDKAFEACRKAAKLLAKTLNTWLQQSPDFQPIVNLLVNHLQDSTSTRILLATENNWLRRLPWCEWNLLEHIPNAEIVLASPKFKQVKGSGNSGKKEKVKILVILGDNAGTDADQAVIQQLIPDAEICWLKEPQRRDLDAPLWEKQWDILFFAGHGKTESDGSIGKIQINSKDTLTIDEIKNHLKRAINNGLKLAIFNACDGLGIAYQLAEGEDLYLPQIIVMREILPIAIAPKFLEHFLKAYTQGLSLSAAIRDSRKELQIQEKDFPCASWLPVLCQNPAEIPLRWHDLVIPPNPYQGLSAFQEKDAALFFGRETFTNQLVKVVETKKLVAVIGASGSGKSSVVLAGLIPSLRQQENWLIASLRPESTPFDNLAKALLSPVAQLETGDSAGVAEVNADKVNQLAIDLQEGNRTLSDVVKSIGSSRRFLLVIDQFEEIYTYPNQKSRQFLDCLLDAVQNFSAFRLVITLRADFLGQAIEYNPFREQLDRWKPEFIGGMARTELQAAIEEPAKKRNVYLEAGLTEHILNEVGEEPGNLPLLEFALTELWKQQENGLLTRLKYDEIGGVEKALCRHAEGVYDALKEGDKERTKQIFMKLVSPGEGTEYTRQLATRAEVGEENWDLVTHLATARLVVSNRNETTEIETVEIVHEALIKAWPDLRKWIEENDTFLRWKKRLKVAFLEWERNENKEGYLLQGAPLGEAEGYLLQRLEEISKAEQVFIQLGLGLRDRNRRRTILGLASGLLAVSIFAVGAVWQWQRAERQSLISETDSLGNLALSQFQSGEGGINALKIALEAGYKLKQLVKDGESLTNYPTNSPFLALQTITKNIREKNEFKSDDVTLNKVIVTPDGKQIVSLSQVENKIIIWNLSGQIITEWNEPDNQDFYDLAISPDGKYIVTIGENSKLYIWDFSGKQIAKLNYLGDIVRFTPDSQYIVAASRMDTKIIFFDLSGQKAKEFSINGGGTIHSLDFTANGQEIVVGNAVGIVQFWNLKTLQKIREFKANTNQVTKVAISPDGQRLLTLGVDVNLSKTTIPVARLWDLSGQKIADFSFSQTLTSEGDVSFSPDGQQIATVTPGEGSVKLYDTRSGNLIDQLTISSLFGFGLSYSPDGQTIFISGIEGIKLLNIAQPHIQSYITELPTNYEEEVNGVKYPTMRKLQFNADGQKLFISTFRNQILDVWDWQQKEVKILNFREIFVGLFPDLKGQGFVNLSPDGKSVIFVTKESVQKRDLTGNLISEVKTNVAKEELLLHTFSQGKYIGDENYSSSFDGSKIVTTGFNGDNLGKLGRESSYPLRLWDLSTQQVRELKHDSLPETIGRVVVSPNGQYILTITSGMGKLWDASGNLLNPLDVNNKSSANGKEFSMPAILLDTSKTETFVLGYGLVYGFKILDVWQNSTAIKAGLKSGDIILQIDGHKISDLKNDDVWKAYDFLKGKPGTTVKIKVESRNYKIEEKTITREKFVFDQTIMILGNTAKFSPDSKYLATWDRAGKELDLRNINSNKLINLDNQASILDAYFSPDSKLIVTTGADYSIKIWDFSGKLINQIKLQQSPNALTFSPDSQQIAFLGYPNELSIWSIAGKLIAKYTVPESGHGLIQFSPDGKHIATGGRKVMIWRNQNLDELLATGCDWLKDYFVTRPEEKQKLKVCQDHPKSK